ncbi:MAG: hypothetical protein ACREXR_21470, partial [Gammaproteobacteria bacterium]
MFVPLYEIYFRVCIGVFVQNLPIAVLFAIAFSGPVWAENSSAKAVFTLDFADQADGDAKPWLKANGFQFKLDANDLSPHFSHKRLVLETNTETAGYFLKRVNLPHVKGIRIFWGVDRYPQGADWEQGFYRVPIAVVISF